MKSVGFIWALNAQTRFHLKNHKIWSCKLMSFNLKNKKCHLKNDKNDHVLQALMTEIAVHRCYLGNYHRKHVWILQNF